MEKRLNTSPKVSRFIIIEIALILVVSALAYLPNISQAGYYRDDWYYMVDRLKGGPGVFPYMFAIDRPARGPLLEGYYSILGLNPLPYHLVAYAWRVVGGLAAFWLFKLLWPGQRWADLLGGLLFTIYPGYLWWVEGVEYQPIVISAALQVISIGMTLQAVNTRRTLPKVAWIAGSVLTGWTYLALVDYAMGMEVFRFLCVFVVVCRGQNNLFWVKKGLLALRAWAIYAIIPVGLLIWRLFFFQEVRSDTNLGTQLGVFIQAPLLTGVRWVEHYIQSALNVGVLAWGAPFYLKFPLLFSLQWRQLALSLLLAGCAVLCVILAQGWLKAARRDEESAVTLETNAQQGAILQTGTAWQAEAMWIGLLGVLAGIVPVIIANRYIIFDYFSHYTLPASLAAVSLAIGLIFCIRLKAARLVVICVLVATAVLTHHAVSSQAVQEERIVSNFWWQVTWRTPNGIAPGTTLLAYYPGVNYGENTEIVYGPANFIFFPQKVNQLPVPYPLSALNMTFYMPRDVLAGGPSFQLNSRSHTWTIRYDQILAMSQPTVKACVHIFDGNWPRFSFDENELMRLVGQTSQVQTVLPPGNQPIRPPIIPFGSEPVRGWCYYYEKAELALQLADYPQVSELGSQAAALKLAPADPVEWMPFVQAYAALGDQASLIQVAQKIIPTRILKLEACTTLNAMQSLGTGISAESKNLFCQ